MADYRSTTHTDFFFLPFTGGDRKSKRITATKGGERANIVGESKHPWHGFSSSHRRSINATQFFSIPPYFFPPLPSIVIEPRFLVRLLLGLCKNRRKESFWNFDFFETKREIESNYKFSLRRTRGHRVSSFQNNNNNAAIKKERSQS